MDSCFQTDLRSFSGGVRGRAPRPGSGTRSLLGKEGEVRGRGWGEGGREIAHPGQGLGKKGGGEERAGPGYRQERSGRTAGWGTWCPRRVVHVGLGRGRARGLQGVGRGLAAHGVQEVPCGPRQSPALRKTGVESCRLAWGPRPDSTATGVPWRLPLGQLRATSVVSRAASGHCGDQLCRNERGHGLRRAPRSSSPIRLSGLRNPEVLIW